MLSRTNRRDRRGALPQRVPVPMLVLSAFIVLGVILGYVFALRSLQSAGGELKQYFDAFLSGGVNRPFSVRALGETLLCYFRAPGIVFLLGFASIGIVAVPLVCACQGFLLSYSLFCFALSLGRGSFPLLLALFGIRLLAVLPCTLLLGNASLDKSRALPTEVYGKLREGAELGECSINPLIQAGGIYVEKDADYTFGDPLQLTSDFYGSGSQVKISCDNEKLAQFLGLPMSNADNIPTGKDAKLTIDATSAFGNHCTYTTDGNKITITNRSGFEISFLAEEGYSDITPIQLDVTNIGTLTLQIGANEHQTMDVRIPEISTDSLYIDNLDVTTVNGADRAIMQLDDALEKVSSARSKIGAYQNRLDHAINSLEQEGQDMTAALSRIEDVDMAGEMTEYTKDNVLTQAATSVLAQANDIPQQVLQLLQ